MSGKGKVSGENLVTFVLENWRTREDLNLRPSASEDYSGFFDHFFNTLKLLKYSRFLSENSIYQCLAVYHQKQQIGKVSGEYLVSFSEALDRDFRRRNPANILSQLLSKNHNKANSRD